MPLKKSRQTEKASILAGAPKPVYVFDAAKRANKIMIRQAIVKQYKVKPTKIAVLNSQKGKKAYIYLRPGDKLDVQ